MDPAKKVYDVTLWLAGLIVALLITTIGWIITGRQLNKERKESDK